MTEKVIWTIGHSNHSFYEFVTILKSFMINMLVDIRSYPGSAKYPHFNKAVMESALPESSVRYIHLEELGGRRKVLPGSSNDAWKVPAFRGYADYMETGDFKKAGEELINIASSYSTAIMCAEVLWWRCHRSLVSDWLKFNGWKVIHIMGTGKSSEHPYTKPARVMDGKLVYSKEQI